MIYAFTLWLTPLWSSLPGVCGLTLWSVVKMIVALSKKNVLLHNTGLPTLAAAASWRFAQRAQLFLWVVMPVLSFTLFSILVGSSLDMTFAVSWLTLPVLALMPSTMRTHQFATAWHASITAHIVGTFIALLLGAPVAWSALAAVVPMERLVAAVGITVVSWGLNSAGFWIRSYIRSWSA